MNTNKIIALIVILWVLFLANVNIHAENIETNVPALKTVFANDFYFGCLLSYKHVGFQDDPAVPGQSSLISPNGGTLIKYHMNSMSPGNNMKAVYTIDIKASAEAYNNAGADKKTYAETHPVVRFNGDLIAQLNWAKRNGFTFRGHTLVWHSQTPPEFFRSGYSATGERVTKEVMLERMENYISEVIRIIHESWPGLLSAVDVVNEAIDDEGYFRSSGNEWYSTFSDEFYVMKAFELTRKYAAQFGEKQIKLYYNDYGTSSSIKADGIVKLCKPIYDAGFLDGIGMQEHDTSSYPTAENWIKSYDKFYPICNEMAVTELDINTNSGTNNPSSQVLELQANQYAMLFKCFIERSMKSGRGKIINVSKDGLNDQYTFIVNQSSSLWDSNYKCKPAFFAVVDVAKNYNDLSGLIAKAEKMTEKDVSKKDWKNISEALKVSKEAMAKNYSANESAVGGLGMALMKMKKAMKIK
jgi:GH35 family endo-1,4-beta-xylanase